MGLGRNSGADKGGGGRTGVDVMEVQQWEFCNARQLSLNRSQKADRFPGIRSNLGA
jgi:hypothetical protein